MGLRFFIILFFAATAGLVGYYLGDALSHAHFVGALFFAVLLAPFPFMIRSVGKDVRRDLNLLRIRRNALIRRNASPQ